MKTRCLIFLLCLLSPAQGQVIYKYVDAEGKVSYSSTKPNDTTDVKIIDAPREPSEEEIDAAQQRQAKLEQSLQRNRARKKGEEYDRAKKHKQAEKKLQQTIDNNGAATNPSI